MNSTTEDTEGQTKVTEETLKDDADEIAAEKNEDMDPQSGGANDNSAEQVKSTNEDFTEIEKDNGDQTSERKEDIKDSIDEININDTEVKEEKEAVEMPDEKADEKNENKDSETMAEDEAGETAQPEPKAKEQDEWLDILGNGLLKKKVMKPGVEGGARPVAGQEVCIKSEGTVDNGDKVDVFEEKIFIMGDGDVITAWDLCVSTMTVGEVCQLITAPRFAYGALGREDDDADILPDSEITYILELISIKKGPNIAQLMDEERLEFGNAKRERGNELFRREDYPQAVYSYSRALKYLEPSTSEEVMALKVKCWNNIGASHLKVKEYTAALTACESVLEVEPDNVKALFRKGKVLSAQGEYEEAVELLRRANTLDPENRLVRKELYIAKQKLEEAKEKERTMYKRMVDGLGDKSDKSEDNKSFFTWPVILGITGVALGGIVAALLLSKHQF